MTSFIALHIALSARLGLSGGNRLAEIKPIPNQAYKGRTRATPIQSAHIYVTVLRDHRPRRAPRPLFPSASSFRSKLWLMDSCSAHRCQKAADRLRSHWPSVVLVHCMPVAALHFLLPTGHENILAMTDSRSGRSLVSIPNSSPFSRSTMLPFTSTASPPASLAIRKAPSASVESIEPRPPRPCEVGRPKGRRRKSRRQSQDFF